MYRRDYMLRLVEDFSKILARLAGLKLEGKFEQASQLIKETYTDYLRHEKDTITSLDNIALEAFLSEQKLSAEQLEVLMGLLIEEADFAEKMNNYEVEKDRLQKSFIVIQFLIKSQPFTFSLGLQQKLVFVAKKLQKS